MPLPAVPTVGLRARRLGVAAGLLASVGAGVVLALSLPPRPLGPAGGWWWGPVGAGMVFALGRDRPARWRGASGAASGLGLYGAGLWWATDFHAVGYVALVVVESLLLAGALTLAPPTRGRTPAVPLTLALVTVVRATVPFGGLPLAGLELGQVGGPFAEAARLGGPPLVVGLMAAAGVGVTELAAVVRRRLRAPRPRAPLALRRLAPAVVAVATAVAGATAGSLGPDGRPVGTVAVAAVQGGGPRGLRAVDVDPGATFEAHLAASALVPAGTELVLWPEDVVDVDRPVDATREGQRASALARDLDASLVAGVVEETPGGSGFRNAAVAWGPDGRLLDRTEKVHRVPFGEYIPLRGLLEGLVDLGAVPRDAVVGEGPGVLDTAAGPVAVTISFEVFFPELARTGVRRGGEVLLVPTNASSYRTAQVPAQEVAAARLRALETGRWVVQAAPTGYSAVIDHRGRVRRRGPLGAPAVLAAEVGRRRGDTAFSATGQAPWTIVAGLGLAVSWLRGRKVESLTISLIA